MFIIKSFIPTKILVAHHFDKMSMFTGQNSHTRLGLLWIYGDEEHENLWFKFLYSWFNKHSFQINRIMQK